MATMELAGGARFDLGRVVQQTFGVIGRNASGFLLASAILVAAPSLVMGAIQLSMAPPDPSGAPNFSVPAVLLGLVGFVVQIVGSSLLQAALIQATVTDLNGGKAAPMAGLGLASSLMLPVTGLSFLTTIGVAVGAMLLIVPGVILAIMWAVALPVLVVEKRGVLESLQRSSELTRGSRWAIFFLTLAYVIVYFLLYFLVAGVSAALGIVSGPGASSAVALVITTVVPLVSSMLGATGGAVIYSELRSAKEGVRPHELASLFD